MGPRSDRKEALMDTSAVASQLLAALGGRENILANDACMTRLRVGVRDRSSVDMDAIRAIDGVMGVVDADTLQVVFGPGTVNKVLEAFVALSVTDLGGRFKCLGCEIKYGLLGVLRHTIIVIEALDPGNFSCLLLL